MTSNSLRSLEVFDRPDCDDQSVPVIVSLNRGGGSGSAWAMGEGAAEALRRSETLSARGLSVKPMPVTVKLGADAIQTP